MVHQCGILSKTPCSGKNVYVVNMLRLILHFMLNCGSEYSYANNMWNRSIYRHRCTIRIESDKIKFSSFQVIIQNGNLLIHTVMT